MCCIQIAGKNGTLRCAILKVAHTNMLKIAHHFSLCSCVSYDLKLTIVHPAFYGFQNIHACIHDDTRSLNYRVM